MKAEVINQVRTVRNELDVLLGMLIDEEEPDDTSPQAPQDEVSTSEYLSVHDVASRLGVTSATVYRWANAGRIPAGVQWGPRTRRWRASDFRG